MALPAVFFAIFKDRIISVRLRQHYILFICIFFLASCKKKDKTEPESTAGPTVTIPSPAPPCEDLPPTPQPFGWYDTITDRNKAINTFLFDPSAPNRIMYVVDGDIFGHNKLFFYDVPSKQARFICNLGDYLPQVNTRGWITFSDVSNNVFLIKNNGNTILQFTSNQHALNPRWDASGNYIYFYSEPYANIGAQLQKIDTAGQLKDILQLETPEYALFKKSKKALFVNQENTISRVIVRNLDSTEADKVLITGPAFSKPGQIAFDHLTLDNQDENFFWSNSYGIFRCNISSLKIDTLAKNCENQIYKNPLTSLNSNELTYGLEVITPLNSLRLLHTYKAVVMNLGTGDVTEIKLFP